jgi:methylated-DNA-[protein]-cysteine S-methyltransferase
MQGTLQIQTSEGTFCAAYSARGLCSLNFPGRAKPTATEVSQQVQHWHRLTSKTLERMLAGKPPGELPPLDLSAGTPFQQEVWQAMSKIAWGCTASYGDLARDIGRPAAMRAVGAACGANPIPVLVPCHRVLAAHGKLGGFSSGLDWKIKLLALEGIVLPIASERLAVA